MRVLLTISLRNLLRQKRRNILLGIAIALGTAILITANSFSHGISDVLFNKIVTYISGHVSVMFSENGNPYHAIFRNGEVMKDAVKKAIPDYIRVQEAIGVMTRLIGNGRADNAFMVGIDIEKRLTGKELKEFQQNFKMLDGSFLDLLDSAIENPVIVAAQKAKYIKVKKNDIVRVRYRDVYGRDQSARLTVVGIFKPANLFMTSPIFLNVHDLKRLAGYGPHDIGHLFITIKDPRKNAARAADTLHSLLTPKLAAMYGTCALKGAACGAAVMGFKGDSVSGPQLRGAVRIVEGDSAKALSKTGYVISTAMRDSLGAKVGDTCVFSYTERSGGGRITMRLPVTGVFEPRECPGANIVLVNEHDFYNAYYGNWPQEVPAAAQACLPARGSALYGAAATQWILLKRSRTTEEGERTMREIAKLKGRGTTVDVRSMYESASAVLKLESALKVITLAAVMVLFFIILVGVVNTLRMTVRERTREIGTVRAIGMQKNEVRATFLLETFFLGLASAVTGTVLAFAGMAGLSLVKFNVQDNPLGMLLVDGHLNFAPTVLGTGLYIILIICIAVATAYFPARRASNLSAAVAFRHYE
jgi:ABC-type lipoprotein release transport system permease subunit